MLKKVGRAALLALVGCSTQAQNTPYYFSKGLLVPANSRYGREAIYTDPLAYQLYTHTLKTPVAGGVFGVDEQGAELKWAEVTADSTHRIRSRAGFRPGMGGRPGITPGAMRGGIGGTGGYIYLTYTSPKEQVAILNIKGNSQVFANGELHMGDTYNMGYMNIPVKLKKGLNEFYARGGMVVASLTFPTKPVTIYTEDPTLPSILPNGQNSALQGAIVVINTSAEELTGLQIKSILQGKEVTTTLPAIPAMMTRKVAFTFDGSAVSAKGKYACSLLLLKKGKALDQSTIQVEAMAAGESYSSTFVSSIDGSLQYYAVTPQSSANTNNAALFLSVHGAGVEASGQARAYKPKDWGTLVAATNRRPRGFNWEDWGRLDALEVLNIAKNRFKPDPQHIYLTGHSMGGHGTWFLGVTYPDKWAGIAPCAGYPTLKEYGSADGVIPASSNDPMEQMLLRSGNQSDVLKLVTNYKSLGVYVLHGDADRTVPITYARQMKKILSDFHPDMSYYEYPGGEHWFGDQSVDWKPLFDYFKWHQRLADSSVNTIDFMTSNPGISSSFRWASVEQQIQPLQYSHINLNRTKTDLTGTTENVALLKLKLEDFGANQAVKITLDGLAPVSYTTKTSNDSLFLRRENNQWVVTSQPDASQKGPHRYGTFKDAFNNRMVFVYGTKGTKEENEWSLNKARFDAETWYYRGNGAVDIISDQVFSLEKYADRGVILFGNSVTNAAWNLLLSDSPIQVGSNSIKAGAQTWTGDDLATYFVWPIKGSKIASVAVVGGSGLKGMQASSANQYFAGASGFPDFMIYNLDMLRQGSKGVKLAGFFDNNWKLATNLFVTQ
ncbi:MAG: PHB depolymerase family esterase [Siphonobacter sp.]